MSKKQENYVHQVIGYTEKALVYSNNDQVFKDAIRAQWPHRFGPLTMSNMDDRHFRIFKAVFKQIQYGDSDEVSSSSACIDYNIAGVDPNDIVNLLIDMTEQCTVIARESEYVISMCFDESNEILRSAYEWEDD